MNELYILRHTKLFSGFDEPPDLFDQEQTSKACNEKSPCEMQGLLRYAMYDLLHFEVGKSLVRFGHTMGVFFLFKCTTFTFAGRYDFRSQFV